MVVIENSNHQIEYSVFVPAPLRGNKLDQVVFILLVLWYGDFCSRLCGSDDNPLTLRRQ